MSGARFSPEQAQRIIRRAIEMSDRDGRTEGGILSEAELRRAAAEAGVDPRSLDAAIAQEASPKPQAAGPSTITSLESVIAGPATREAALSTLSAFWSASRLSGKLEHGHRSVRWTSRHPSHVRIEVKASPVRGGLRLEGVFDGGPVIKAGAALGFLIGASLALGIAGSADLSAGGAVLCLLMAPLAALLTGLVASLSIRPLLRRFRKGMAEAETILERSRQFEEPKEQAVQEEEWESRPMVSST